MPTGFGDATPAATWSGSTRCAAWSTRRNAVRALVEERYAFCPDDTGL
jgi:hypothetical protein